MKGNKIMKRVLPIMLAVMVGLMFSFTITTADASALSKPGKVKSLTVTYDSVYPGAAMLKWKKVSKATGYKVYRSTYKAKGFKCIKTIKGKSNTAYCDNSNDLSCDGKTWYYKVRAYKKKGKKTKYGKYSSVKSFENPLVDVVFNPYEYAYDDDIKIHYMKVEVSNLTSGAIIFANWLKANDDKCDYKVVSYYDGNEFEPVTGDEDLIVAPNTSMKYLLHADKDVKEPFLNCNEDWFKWTFMTLEEEYINNYDLFFGDWYQGNTTVYFVPNTSENLKLKASMGK